MSEWMDGFRTKPATPDDVAYGWSSYWGRVRNNRALSEKAFDYAGRLMQAARAIDDVELKSDVKKADFLSYLVNLGGSYAALNPYTSLEELKSFLQPLWQDKTSTAYTKSNQELVRFLGGGSLSLQDKKQILEYQKNQFLTLSKLSEMKEKARDPKLLAAVGILSRYYQSDLKESNLSQTDNNFFTDIWSAKSRSQLGNIANDINTRSVNASSLNSESILKALLGSNSRQSAQLVGRPSPATIYSLPSNITPWLTIDPNRPKVTPVGQAVGNKKALIIAPYAHEFEPDGGDESDEIKQILENSGFTVTIRRNDDQNVNNIDIRRDFMQAEPGGYGVVVFSTHGAGFRGSAPMSAGQVNIPTGLFTGQTLTSQAVVDYAELLVS
jgi:hypothetical protein